MERRDELSPTRGQSFSPSYRPLNHLAFGKKKDLAPLDPYESEHLQAAEVVAGGEVNISRSGNEDERPHWARKGDVPDA
jgi:hypothetical protein